MTPLPVHLLVLQDGGWPAGTHPVPILRVTLLVFASSVLAIMCKRDVIRVTGSTFHIATPPEKCESTAIFNMHKN